MKTLIFMLLFLCGCAALDQATQDAINCRKDPVCYQMAKDRASLGGEVAGMVNPVAGGAVGAAILTFGLWLGGRKKRKEGEK